MSDRATSQGSAHQDREGKPIEDHRPLTIEECRWLGDVVYRQSRYQGSGVSDEERQRFAELTRIGRVPLYLDPPDRPVEGMPKRRGGRA